MTTMKKAAPDCHREAAHHQDQVPGEIFAPRGGWGNCASCGSHIRLAAGVTTCPTCAAWRRRERSHEPPRRIAHDARRAPAGWSRTLHQADGVTRPIVTRRLLFGRFLAFSPSGTNPRNLTERRFRDYWERTDKTEKNERIRFRAVLDLIEQDTRVGKPTAKKPKVAEASEREHLARVAAMLESAT